MNRKVPFYSHFLELRFRIFYLFVSFCFTFLVCYIDAFDFLFLFLQPVCAPKNLIFTDITEALSAIIYLCLVVTLHLLIPLLLYNYWAFLVPGFLSGERKKWTYLLLFLFIFLLVGGGVLFNFLVPEIVTFLSSFGVEKELVSVLLEARIQPYISFTCRLYFSLLFFFQLPFLSFFFFKWGVLAASNLAIWRRPFYFVTLLVAAILSPPDLVYQVALAFCFAFLYELTIWLGFIYEKRCRFD